MNELRPPLAGPVVLLTVLSTRGQGGEAEPPRALSSGRAFRGHGVLCPGWPRPVGERVPLDFPASIRRGASRSGGFLPGLCRVTPAARPRMAAAL